MCLLLGQEVCIIIWEIKKGVNFIRLQRHKHQQSMMKLRVWRTLKVPSSTSNQELVEVRRRFKKRVSLQPSQSDMTEL